MVSCYFGSALQSKVSAQTWFRQFCLNYLPCRIGDSQIWRKERYLGKTPFLTFVHLLKCNITLAGTFGHSNKVWIEPVILLFSVWIEARGHGSQISADSGEHAGRPKKRTFRTAGQSPVTRLGIDQQLLIDGNSESAFFWDTLYVLMRRDLSNHQQFYFQLSSYSLFFCL